MDEEKTKLQIARNNPFFSAFKWLAGQISQIVKTMRFH